MNIADQIELVRLKIDQCCEQANRDPAEVQLLAVSKTHPVSLIQAAIENGVTEFAESYLQESLVKIAHFKNELLSWHFIGPIQSNKTKPIAENFNWVQSADREKILRRLSEQRPASLAPLQICIQANLFNEPQKQGATIDDLPKLLDLTNSLPQLQLRGLMVIPPPQSELKLQIQQFEKVAQIFQQLQIEYPMMDTLSMGMSDDIEAAIACGSNMVRVGTGIFGRRGSHHAQ